MIGHRLYTLVNHQIYENEFMEEEHISDRDIDPSCHNFENCLLPCSSNYERQNMDSYNFQNSGGKDQCLYH